MITAHECRVSPQVQIDAIDVITTVPVRHVRSDLAIVDRAVHDQAALLQTNEEKQLAEI
jgi:hypothetical protein